MNTKKRIVVAMSGGVDSSTAAAILASQGNEVIGVSLHLFDYSVYSSTDFGACCSLSDIEDARRVAEKLQIPFYVINFEEEFRKEVIGYFVSEYIAAKTPNPCILCNQRIKFHHLLRKAKEIGADYLATGHYARIGIDEIAGRYYLKKGIDPAKDQSYFLFSLSQKELGSLLFPVGEYTKGEVRVIAKKFGLKVSDKKESQEICFIPDKDYPSFIKRELNTVNFKEGNIVTPEGEILGKHNGIPFFTIGQRKGLGIAAGKPLYVLGLRPDRNEVVVGEKTYLKTESCLIGDVIWNAIEKPSSDIDCMVKFRYQTKEAEAVLTPLEGERVRCRFLKPQLAITPGQAAVFYDGDIVLGGGWIARENWCEVKSAKLKSN